MITEGINRIPPFDFPLEKRICDMYSSPDESLFMTATILLYNRVDNLKITSTLHNHFDPDAISLNPDVFSFHWFEGVKDGVDELLKPIKENFASIEKMPVHEKFLLEQLKKPVYIRKMPHENTVCVFMEKCTFSVFHAVQFFISKFFPIFDKKPLTDEEKTFLTTLTYNSEKKYHDKLRDLANSESFRGYVLKGQLEKFEKKLFEKKLQAAKHKLESIELDMDKALDQYRRACNARVEAIALVSGLKEMADNMDEHTQLQKYLTNNPRLSCVNLYESDISFIVKTFFAPHHIEDWERISQRNQIFTGFICEEFPHKEEIKLLLDAILSENRCLKVKMCAYFSLDYFGSRSTTSKNYNFTEADSSLKDYIPNPHLNLHRCFGQNEEAILVQLRNGDAIGAIECCIACAQRVNIHENISFDPFVKDILKSQNKCLVAEDGTEMTPKKAVEYLKGRKNG